MNSYPTNQDGDDELKTEVREVEIERVRIKVGLLEIDGQSVKLDGVEVPLLLSINYKRDFDSGELGRATLQVIADERVIALEPDHV